MAAQTYGRHRLSIANIEDELHALIEQHPRSHVNDNGEPVIPGDALVDILASYTDSHGDIQLLSKEEEAKLIQFLSSNPGIEATPKLLVEFIALRTTPSNSADSTAVHSDEGSENESPEERGRLESRGVYDSQSRSSSTDSTGTSVYRSHSRPPSRGVPTTPGGNDDSPFDASKRQRSTPLAAPSSWSKRPAPASRRKSDAGSQGRAFSDSESPTPSAWGRRNSRSRAPSNPTSPTMASFNPSLPSESFSPILTSSSSRPHSRNQSYSQSQYFNTLDSHYNSQDRGSFSPPNSGGLSSSPPGSADTSLDEVSFLNSINSLPMPRNADSSDSDSDGEEPSMLVYDRSATSSTASLEPTERLEALQRINTDLSKKLIEAERTLQNRLTEHETELEDMQSRLEEAKIELTATKKEEKELRAKERQNFTQISALESEIAKLQKNLDNSRVSYQSLQKQYQEQCVESERYRNTLRRRDEEIKDYRDAAAVQVLETQKWARDLTQSEDRVIELQGELLAAQQTHASLDGQKQENLLLKETIDRLRFEMDEMRSAAAANMQYSGSGSNSARGSLSRSFQAELLRAGADAEDPAEEAEEADTSGETEIPDIAEEQTDEEDYIQTIITKTRKRKIPGRPALATVHLEEITKEYSDVYVQYDATLFIQSVKIQTDPGPIIPTTSSSIQTDEVPRVTFSVQTDPDPTLVPKVTFEMEIQTELEPEVASAQEDEDASASSSTTLLPPTPKPEPEHQRDLPPAYNQFHQDTDEVAIRIANETLKQWHNGLQPPIEPLPGGVSMDAVEEWKALKGELGVKCLVIEKIIEDSEKTGRPRPSSSKTPSSRSSQKSRFYNIYNTYVYGNGSGESSNSLATNMLFCVGASAIAVFIMNHISSSPQYVIPGGPTYYDRAAWSSFNTMHATGEGFTGDGTSVVWNFLGRFASGAARIVQGWPA